MRLLRWAETPQDVPDLTDLDRAALQAALGPLLALMRKTCLPCRDAIRTCIRAPDRGPASMTADPRLMPAMTALRTGNEVRVGGASGQNCEMTAPDSAIRSASAAFSCG